MHDNLSLLISVGIPAIISIAGFAVTFFTLKEGFHNELAKQKANVQLEKMSVMPYEVLTLLQEFLDAGRQGTSSSTQQEFKEKMNRIYSTIYAYGSSKAIHILAAMQSESYQNAAAPGNLDNFRMVAFYILLTVQIRVDITGEIVSPEEWFKLKLKDFPANREKIKAANNRLVDELELDRQFLIK